MIAGTKLSEVFDAAVDLVKKEKPSLVDKMTKSGGLVLWILSVTFNKRIPFRASVKCLVINLAACQTNYLT